VLTHGEPHPGNTLRTKDGWRLIDWDTVRIAPPERDLWLLGGDLTAYTDATGVEVLPEMLTLFRLRWDIADLAVEVDRFRRPHAGDANDEKAWQILRWVIGGI
jgi:spectinomycin phosphotransferase/16S rRNA (guanine(1405)-N(7))-methyltransferase